MSSPPVLPDAILGPGHEVAERGENQVPLRALDQGLDQVGQAALVQADATNGAGGPGAGPPALADSRLGGLTKKSRDTALIAQRDARIRKKATDIVLSALRAPETAELPEGALQAPPPGWTKRALRIALDATNSMKAAPAYLGMAQRILESYRKAEAETSKPAPVLNATQVVVHQEFHYPTIKVER